MSRNKFTQVPPDWSISGRRDGSETHPSRSDGPSCRAARRGVRGWKRDRFTVRIIEPLRQCPGPAFSHSEKTWTPRRAARHPRGLIQRSSCPPHFTSGGHFQTAFFPQVCNLLDSPFIRLYEIKNKKTQNGLQAQKHKMVLAHWR